MRLLSKKGGGESGGAIEVSPDEALRFVDLVGGYRRFRGLLGADGPASSASLSSAASASKAVRPPVAAQVHVVEGEEADYEVREQWEEDRSDSSDMESMSLLTEDGDVMELEDEHHPTDIVEDDHEDDRRDGVRGEKAGVGTRSAPGPASPRDAKGRKRPRLQGSASAPSGTSSGRTAAEDEELSDRMSERLFAYLLSKNKGNENMENFMEGFSDFSTQALADPELRDDWVRYLDMPATPHHLIRRLGVKAADIMLVRDSINSLDTGAGARTSGQFRVYRAGPTPTHGDLLRVTSSIRKPPLFDFIHQLKPKQMERAQLSAQVLAKQGRFMVSCPQSRVQLRELSFKARRVRGGERGLEARFTGSIEKYPLLQPWVIPAGREDVMFYGLRGKEVSDMQRQLVDPVLQIWDAKETLSGGRVFHVTLLKSEPVLWIFSIHRGFVLGEVCIGAADKGVLKEYFKFLDEMSTRYSRMLESGEVPDGFVM